MQGKKQAKNRSLCLINEHFEPVFNAAVVTQIVFNDLLVAKKQLAACTSSILRQGG